MRTRSQIWSKVAFERVSKVAMGEGKGTPPKYNTSCNKMPGLIHQSGALQAIVFQVARDEAGKQYVDDLAAAYWAEEKTPKDHKDLIAFAQKLELKPYMAFTRDLAEIAQWFRRFAQIELKGVSADDRG
jgi:CRISPR type III-B/RAMP module-associated protein Cmr5